MNKYETWVHNKWRPAIGWLYFIVVLFDFAIIPVFYANIQSATGTDLIQWNPLTLQGNGLFHVSMLGIVGVTAYGRTKEKLKQMQKDTETDE